MKKFFTLIMCVLALNFLAAVGGVAWLFQSGHLDKGRIKQVRELLFPPPVAAAAATQPSADSATTRPFLRLDDLMAQQVGLPASEQVALIHRTFETENLELDRKQREVEDLKRQVDLANQKLAADRKALEQQQAQQAALEQQQNKLQNDKGFQDSLSLYTSMPSKQVKTIFMTLSEPIVEQYLDAMPPRTATKIIKEFNKTPDEIAFIQRVLERMRNSTAPDSQSQATLANSKQP
jgi:hypothetical protein